MQKLHPSKFHTMHIVLKMKVGLEKFIAYKIMDEIIIFTVKDCTRLDWSATVLAELKGIRWWRSYDANLQVARFCPELQDTCLDLLRMRRRAWIAYYYFHTIQAYDFDGNCMIIAEWNNATQKLESHFKPRCLWWIWGGVEYVPFYAVK